MQHELKPNDKRRRDEYARRHLRGSRRPARNTPESDFAVRALNTVLVPILLGIGLVACSDSGSRAQPAKRVSTGPASAHVTAGAARDAAAHDTTPSLSDVATTRALIGRRVRVTGRCLTLNHADVLSMPLRSRDAWQLEGDGVSILVTGKSPCSCASRGDAPTLAITAVIAEDTLPPIGDLPAAPRRYLDPVESFSEQGFGAKALANCRDIETTRER